MSDVWIIDDDYSRQEIAKVVFKLRGMDWNLNEGWGVESVEALIANPPALGAVVFIDRGIYKDDEQRMLKHVQQLTVLKVRVALMSASFPPEIKEELRRMGFDVPMYDTVYELGANWVEIANSLAPQDSSVHGEVGP